MILHAQMLPDKGLVSDRKKCRKWTIHFYDSVGSTNDIARGLPPWHAVRARSQTAGRGRQGRRWVSDGGGLWLSLVLPTGEKKHLWKTLPLAVGWAIVKVVKGLGVHEARLRWPNDIMVGDLKLAGVLIEQFREGAAVVGAGINVFNRPAQIRPELANTATSLSDFTERAPHLDELTGLILEAMEHIHHSMEEKGFSAILDEIDTAFGWGKPRRVELHLDGGIQRGFFSGVDERGYLITKNESHHTCFYSPLQVKLFREV